MKIQELEIYTPKLEAQTDFYNKVLEFNIVERTNNSVSFEIGGSVLKLMHSEEHRPYHFAFNIPANQEQEALQWLKQRVEIIKYENSEIQYFDFWNAHAIYFYDADGNIVEFIARKTLGKHSNEAFSKNSIIEICEIGLPTDDISVEYKTLNEATHIPVYSGSVEHFCAIGDEQGLFILINKNSKKEWFPTSIKTESVDFKIKFIENNEPHIFEYKDGDLVALVGG